jgi:hypothetical protein
MLRAKFNKGEFVPEFQGGSRGQSIHNLLGDALRESTDLARKEFSLFRTEMGETSSGLVIGIGCSSRPRFSRSPA